MACCHVHWWQMFIRNVSAMAKYSPVKMGKTDLVKGEKLFAGLNSLEPGQEHALHAHEGQEKMYFVLEGAGEVQVGETTETLGVGDMAFAPCGVPHSVRNPGPERLVVMVVMGLPPGK